MDAHSHEYKKRPKHAEKEGNQTAKLLHNHLWNLVPNFTTVGDWNKQRPWG